MKRTVHVAELSLLPKSVALHIVQVSHDRERCSSLVKDLAILTLLICWKKRESTNCVMALSTHRIYTILAKSGRPKVSADALEVIKHICDNIF